MSLYCRDILSLEKLKEIKVAAGHNGLDRSIRWIYIAECISSSKEIVNWIFGGELVIITGQNLKGDQQAFLDLIHKLNEKNVAGIIINIGPYIENVSEDICDLANKLSLPVFELPWEVKLVDITKEICSAIIKNETKKASMENALENILYGNISYEEELTEEVLQYGVDLKKDYVFGIVGIDSFEAYINEKGIDEYKTKEINTYLYWVINEELRSYSIDYLSMIKNNAVVFLIKYNLQVKDKINRIIIETREKVNNRFQDIKISAGIGKNYTGINRLKISFQQAEQALKAARFEFGGNFTCFYYNLGVYLLLLKVNDRNFMEEFYNDMFLSVIEYDKSTNSKLMETFEAFLKTSCNIMKTADALFIHKNTLKYRLQKVEKLLGCDLHDFQQLFEYQIGFKVGRFINK